MTAASRSAAEELVPVMVPRSLLSPVYGFIASHDASRDSSASTEVLHRGWNKELVVEAYRAASPRMRTLLDLLATRAGESVCMEDFLEALGEDDPDVVNGALGAFGRLTSQHFAPRLPGKENTWPFTASKDIRDGRWSYMMPPAVAEVVRSL